MEKPSFKAAFAFPLLLISIAAFAALWFRAESTPPWRTEITSTSQAEVTAKTKANAVELDQPFTFITYNVKNWLVSKQSPEKSTESKAAIVRILANAHPDIIGLCEIGTENDVHEIQEDLKASGLDLPHSYYTGGADSVRHLAIISRFPIISTESPDLRIPENNYSMQRGILDVTISIGESRVRFIGLHLKSKRNVPEFDQAMARIDEASHARNHIDGILKDDPDCLLVAYGDFNDTTRSISTRSIFGTYRSPGYMAPIHVKDSRGENWTHSWAREDIYTRIDFVTVSKALLRHVSKAESKVVDDPDWEKASDHRPVLVRFK